MYPHYAFRPGTPTELVSKRRRVVGKLAVMGGRYAKMATRERRPNQTSEFQGAKNGNIPFL